MLILRFWEVVNKKLKELEPKLNNILKYFLKTYFYTFILKINNSGRVQDYITRLQAVFQHKLNFFGKSDWSTVFSSLCWIAIPCILYQPLSFNLLDIIEIHSISWKYSWIFCSTVLKKIKVMECPGIQISNLCGLH